MGSNDDSSRENLNGIPRNRCASLTEKLWGVLCRNGEADEARMEEIGHGIFVEATSQPFRCPLLAEVFARLYRRLKEAEGGEVANRFRKCLLNACQTSFNDGVLYELGAAERSAGEDPQGRARSLGTMRLLAELFSQRIISERILHNAVTKLLGTDRPNPGLLRMLAELLTHVVAHVPRMEEPGRFAEPFARLAAMAEALPDAALHCRLFDLLQQWQTQGAAVPQEAGRLDGEGEAVSSPAPLGREGEATAEPMAEYAPVPQPPAPPCQLPGPVTGPESGALGPCGSPAVPGAAAFADVPALPPMLPPPVSPILAQRALLDVIRGDDVDFPVPLPLLLQSMRDANEAARQFLTVLCAGPRGLTAFVHFVRDTLGIFPEEFACCILWPLDGTVLLRKLAAPAGPNCPPPPVRPFRGCHRTAPLPRHPIPVPGPAALPHPLPPPCPPPQFWPAPGPHSGPLGPGLAVPLALAAAASVVPAPPALVVDAVVASIPQGAGADKEEEGEEEQEEEEEEVANDTLGKGPPSEPAAMADVVPGPVRPCQLTVKLVGLAAAIQLAQQTAAPTPANPVRVASGLHAQVRHEVGLEEGEHQSPPTVVEESGSSPQDVSGGGEPPSKDEGSATPEREWEAASCADEGRTLPAERTPRHRGPGRGAQRSPPQPPDYGIQEAASGLAMIFVKGMKETITEAEVLAFFSRIGPVRHLVLKQNKGRPYAFVYFVAAADASRAVAIADVFDSQAAGITEGDTKLHVAPPLTREELQKQREYQQLLERYGRGNLFVSKLDKAVDEPALWAAFERFGEIACAKVSDNSYSGFVCFKDPAAAQRAKQQMDGAWLSGRQLRVTEAQCGQEDEESPQLEPREDDVASSVKIPEQTRRLVNEDVDVISPVSPPPPRPPLSVAVTRAGATTSLCENSRPPNYATLHPKVNLDGPLLAAAGLPFPATRDIVTFWEEVEADGFRRVVEVPAVGTANDLQAETRPARNSASPGGAAPPTVETLPGAEPPPADVGAGEADGLPEGGADLHPHDCAQAAAPRPQGVHHVDELRGMCQDLQQLYGGCLEGGQQTLQCLAVHCWATPLDTLLLRVATPHVMYVLDVARLGARVLREALRPFLECKHLYKVMHDLRPAAAYLQRLDIRPRSLLDVQLLCEHLTGELQCDISDVLQQCGVVSSPAGLPAEERAAWDLAALAAGCPALLSRLGEALPVVATASLQRAVSIANGDPYDPGYGLVCFDRSRDYRLASYELLRATCDALNPTPAVVDHSGTRDVLELLPAPLRPAAQRLAATVTAFVLDVGRPPQVFCGMEAVDLAEDEAAVVTPEDVGGVMQAAGAGAFETSDCVAFPEVLHRVSCLRNQKGSVTGLTFHVVRPVTGLASLLYDVLQGRPHHNVLFLGEPGSGKSTALRDVARLMSDSLHVLAVDTHGDLGGLGPKPHPSLGKAHRVTPPSLAGQALVMAEAVQREWPEVLVVDQVHRKTEMDVLRMAQRCGVRLAVGAGASGSLHQLLHCRRLAGLLGVEAQEGLDGGLALQRTAAPIFDCVVVLRRAAPGEWTVISNVAEAVDDALKGKPYRVSVRSHDLDTGMVRHSISWM